MNYLQDFSVFDKSQCWQRLLLWIHILELLKLAAVQSHEHVSFEYDLLQQIPQKECDIIVFAFLVLILLDLFFESFEQLALMDC